MKIGKYPVRHSYKPARIISDALSLVMAYVIVSSTLHFFPLYRETLKEIAKKDLSIVFRYRESLAYRQYFAWIFPALTVGIFAAYLILTLKNHKFQKYNITKQNAQAVYDWYAFAVSLCKLPLLLGIIDMMYIFHQRMMFNNVSLFSFQILLCAFVTAIIIRLSVHRIKALTKNESKKAETGGVKARIVEKDDDSNDNSDDNGEN